ncbi:serine phosphatase RsbU (regulator of sigma subunit) [Paenibacillus taihuensis]|uniref:Serine phosphatase RsbU (Regulator of sigma subunit) n=1 Tax=Paenibacillus taihuensis TaxID=1156355 RepID=A0A3D9SK13_9BACL|nr:serine phosphatase RsbU (regulator of sigma subunit) [Paenibacillus taihuensis]
MKDERLQRAAPKGFVDGRQLDIGIRRVMVLASALIALSIILIGSYIYRVTEQEALNKLKARDLPTLAKSISARVDGRIERAVETSLTLSHDPFVLEWLSGEEKDKRLADMISKKTSYLHQKLGYSATFIVGAASRKYWSYDGSLLSVIKKEDPADAWFFDTLAAGREVSINFDTNEELHGVFAFINVLAGSDLKRPLGIVGVGMKLDGLSEEFDSYKEGSGINLWLTGSDGKIYLSDNASDNGRNISDVLPDSAKSQLSENTRDQKGEMVVLEYDTPDAGRVDLIRQHLKSTELQLYVEVERRETTGFLQSIRWNTALAALVIILATIGFFFYISRRMVNPYKRAVEMNRRLEDEIALRTKELSERNEEMLDSINYARLLQQSVLPKPEAIENLLSAPFVLWRPRDVVGGDFFWVKKRHGRTFVAVGDCTGHGVPGAFMTMLALSALNRIAETDACSSPADMLEALNRLIKETLHREGQEEITDDGMSIGLCAIEQDGAVTFAGASCWLYRLDAEGLQSWKGDRRGIGYRRTPGDYRFTNIALPEGKARMYLLTDGLMDQNGGDRDHSFGRKRFEELLLSIGDLKETEQRDKMIQSLESYMGEERQRDDITVLSFLVGEEHGYRGESDEESGEAL